jgi:hypothetical protein
MKSRQVHRHGRSPGDRFSVAVIDSAGKLMMECVLETKAGTIVELF